MVVVFWCFMNNLELKLNNLSWTQTNLTEQMCKLDLTPLSLVG